MFVTFDTISDDARIWVYPANRALTVEEQHLIHTSGKSFIDQWGAHGQPLTASIKVLNSYFVVIAVDDYAQLPSGCSIDASVAFIRELGNTLKVDFFDRTQIALLNQGKVRLAPLKELKVNIKAGKISEDTPLFDTLIQTQGGLASWIVSLKQSWLARFLPQTSV